MEGPSWLFSLSTPEGSPEAPHETSHCPEMGNAFPSWTVVTTPTLSTRSGGLPLPWYGQDYLTGLLSYVGLLPDGFSYNPHCLLGPQSILEYTPPLPTTVFFPFPLFTRVFSLAFKLCFLMYDTNMFPNTKKHSLSFPDVSLKPFSLGLSKEEVALSFLYVWRRGKKRGCLTAFFFKGTASSTLTSYTLWWMLRWEGHRNRFWSPSLLAPHRKCSTSLRNVGTFATYYFQLNLFRL